MKLLKAIASKRVNGVRYFNTKEGWIKCRLAPLNVDEYDYMGVKACDEEIKSVDFRTTIGFKLADKITIAVAESF